MQISSIGYYFTPSQRFYLFTQMLQHLRCLMLVAVETALNHIQIVVAASSIIECKGKAKYWSFPRSSKRFSRNA